MNCAKVFSAVLIISAILSVGQSQAEILPESVVALWLFDKDEGNVATDYSGNGNNGEIRGNVKWVDGQFSTALEFPGETGSFVLVPHSDSLDLVTFTIVAWLKAENTGSRQEIIMKRSAGGQNSQNLHFQIESGHTEVDTGFTVDNQWPGNVFGKTSVVNDDWYHIATTYDQEMLRIYVNGVVDGEEARDSEPDNNDAPLTIGAVFESGDAPLKGTLDEIGLFNVALDEEDINEIMENGLEAAVGIKAVSPLDKLATVWCKIKAE